jgi:hypothetical protein
MYAFIKVDTHFKIYMNKLKINMTQVVKQYKYLF